MAVPVIKTAVAPDTLVSGAFLVLCLFLTTAYMATECQV